MELRAYLRQAGQSRETFASRIKVSTTALYRYLAGERVPHRDVMLRIVRATEGAVQPNDFFMPSADSSPAAPEQERSA